MRFTSEGGSSKGAGGTSSSSSSFFEEEAKRGRVSSNSRLPPSLQLLPTFQLFLLLFVFRVSFSYDGISSFNFDSRDIFSKLHVSDNCSILLLFRFEKGKGISIVIIYAEYFVHGNGHRLFIQI